MTCGEAFAAERKSLAVKKLPAGIHWDRDAVADCPTGFGQNGLPHVRVADYILAAAHERGLAEAEDDPWPKR